MDFPWKSMDFLLDFPWRINGFPLKIYGFPYPNHNPRKVLKSFFDQVLANFFAQLNHLPKLFSLDDISTTNAVQWLEDIPKPFLIFKPFLESYLLKNEDIKDEKKLEKEWNNWIKTNKNNLTQFLQNTLENQEIFYQRRNKILEHLLARFGYDFSTFDNLSSLPPQELINHKLNILFYNSESFL